MNKVYNSVEEFIHKKFRPYILITRQIEILNKIIYYISFKSKKNFIALNISLGITSLVLTVIINSWKQINFRYIIHNNFIIINGKKIHLFLINNYICIKLKNQDTTKLNIKDYTYKNFIGEFSKEIKNSYTNSCLNIK